MLQISNLNLGFSFIKNRSKKYNDYSFGLTAKRAGFVLDENDENEVVEKPGPKSSKKMEEYEPQPSTSGIKPKNKKPRPGPKSKKRKRDDSEDEDDDDSEEFEAKRPRTLNSRQKKLLGQINYNLDED